jgi:hypothetical protein
MRHGNVIEKEKSVLVIVSESRLFPVSHLIKPLSLSNTKETEKQKKQTLAR